MLTPNEVRYGNWILVPTAKNKFEWDRVIEISEHRVVTKFYSQNNSMGYAWKDVKGIELKAELLNMAGFVSNKIVPFIKDRLAITARSGQDYILEWYKGDELMGTPGTSFKDLHELQNIYHSLTGKELELNHSKSLQ